MLTLFFGILTFTHAQLASPPAEGHYQIRGEFSYSTTSANYLPSGSSTALLGNGKLIQTKGTLEVGYDINDQIRAYGGLHGGTVEAHVLNPLLTTPFTIQTDTHTNSGLSEAYLGGQFWYHVADFDLVPEGHFIIPTTRVNQNSVDPLLGEGAIEFRAGGYAMYRISDFTPFGYGGFAYRDGGRSHLFRYRLGARYAYEERFWIMGEFKGFESMTNDSADRNYRDGYLTLVNGGSYEYFAINPSRADVALLAGVQFNQFTIYGGGQMSVFGRGSADIWGAVIGAIFDGQLFGEKKKSEFQERKEKYDDQIFQQNQDPLTPVEEAPEPVRPKSKKPKTAPPKPKEEGMPNVEMLMKETEKSLEKKGK